MKGKSFVDANVLVYLFDGDSPQKQAVARELLAEGGPEGRLVLSTQVLQEFYVTVTRKLAHPLSTARAEEMVRFLAAFPVVAIDATLILAGVATARAHQLSLWDALIVEAARAAGCRELLTEDLAHGSRTAGLLVVDPFRD